MLIKRKIFQDIVLHLSAKEITVITGARQVGKTTLMKEVQYLLDKKNERTIYLNLDFESDFSYFNSQERLLQKIGLEFGNKSGYVFIDEIQRKENAGLFLKGIFDKDLPYKFIVSGSGSMELKAKIHESLSGRKRVFELFPVAFNEFINYKTEYKYEENLVTFFDIEGEKVDIYLNEYLSYGGYPRIITEPQKQEKHLLINEIFNSYIRKDISYLLNINRPDAFIKFIELLAAQTGSIINLSKLSNDTGISVPTLKKYLWYAENTFIIKTLSPFFGNKRKEITKSPTIYFNDVGFRNFAINQFGNFNKNNNGFLFQNFIFNILQSFIYEDFINIHFWRTTDQAEVDFIIKRGNEIIPIEVKYSNLKSTTITRSLRNFINKYKPEKALVINLSYSKTIKIYNTNVEFIPFYKLSTVLNKFCK